MKQQKLFNDNYDIEQSQKEVMLLSDLQDVCHASMQGITAILLAMSFLDDPMLDHSEALRTVRMLQGLQESALEFSEVLLETGFYRGEK